VAPLFGSTTIKYFHKGFRIDLIANYNGKISYDNLAPSERNKPHMYAKDKNGNPYSPAWWTLNIKSSYPLSEVFTMDFGVDNILDVRYRPYSSGIVSPGRNVYITLRAKL
jgi:hemoglobin/transferrin/lactoferrin receptor protein